MDEIVVKFEAEEKPLSEFEGWRGKGWKNIKNEKGLNLRGNVQPYTVLMFVP